MLTRWRVVALSATPGLSKLDGTALQTVWDAATKTLTGYGSSASDVVFTDRAVERDVERSRLHGDAAAAGEAPGS
ncbi:MAG: hypothetical protein MZV49_12375 [Rhodopseudomonas palustris]|nr:hypothetical protein [Rhodopseudomonas palustris]